MTCYLRIHNILAAVRPSSDLPKDWARVNTAWQNATSLLDRQRILGEMQLDEIDLYELAEADITAYCGLILSGRVDQDYLYRHRDVLLNFIEAGNTVVFSGDIDVPWLPDTAPSLPIDQPNGSDIGLAFADHPIFDGISADMVGDYFASGHYVLPPGAKALVTLPQQRAVVYEHAIGTKGGRILLHAGHTLLGYAADARAAELSTRLIPQLLTWIRRGSPTEEAIA